MSDYDACCVNCLHRSHLGKPCPYCPSPTKDNPNSRCTTYVRADVFVAHTMARMEQAQHNAHGQMMAGLSTIFDLLCEVFPDASESLQTKLKERHEAAQAEIEAAQKARKAEAEKAFQEAHEAEAARSEERMQDELAKKYTDPGYIGGGGENLDKPVDNVLSFPSKPTPVPDSDPDPDNEAV